MKQIFEEIIKNWQQQKLPAIKPRSVDLTKLFDPVIKKVICVVGFRRVGKTFLLLDFAKKYGQDRCLYINLEDERLPQNISTLTQLSSTITEIFGNKPLVLLLDEIQNIPGWSSWVRRMNDGSVHRLIISGSSSKLSSRELPTELRGRSLPVQVVPLSWREWLDFRAIDHKTLPKPLLINNLREYLQTGGMPEIVLVEPGLRPLLLAEYYNTFVARDIIERYKIRNVSALRDLVRILLTIRTFTYTKLARTLQSLGHHIGTATIMRYVGWLESCYFFSTLEFFSNSIKQRRGFPKKGYTIDTYFPVRLGANFTDNAGHLMEQVVFLELSRRYRAAELGELYYWKDYDQHEVDFIVRVPGRKPSLLQACHVSSLTDLPERETHSLSKAVSLCGASSATVITWDLETDLFIKNQLISCVPLWKWLLESGQAEKSL